MRAGDEMLHRVARLAAEGAALLVAGPVPVRAPGEPPDGAEQAIPDGSHGATIAGAAVIKRS